MAKGKIGTMGFLTVLIGCALAAGTLFVARARGPRRMQQEPRLTAHEWGTMTTVAGEDGKAITWQPLLAHSDLPGFVYGMGGHLTVGGRDSFAVKRFLGGTVRMETPVIYLYSDVETTASVKVEFPQGNITEWYPGSTGSMGFSGLDWQNLRVTPQGPADLPFDDKMKDSRYYAARATDSNLLRVAGRTGEEVEKFLFYRGVGSCPLPATIKTEANEVRVRIKNAEKGARVILFENRSGRTAYQIQDLVDGKALFDRNTSGQAIDSLRQDLKSMLVSAGLYEKEAGAMLETWGDSWFEEGLRVFYLLPRSGTDSIIPITIKPAPVELVRVMVCRAELITPELEAAVRQEVATADDFAQVRAALLRKYGRFLEPILNRIKETSADSQTNQRIDELIKAALEELRNPTSGG
jgi:hypothetical protein